jgi:endoglucanase
VLIPGFPGFFIQLILKKSKMRIFALVSMILFSTIINDKIFCQPVKEHGQLWVDGTNLKDKNGNVCMLEGVSYGWHNWWPRFYNAGTVKWLRDDWNCSVLRAAMGVEPDSGYFKKAEWSKNKIKAVVDAAIEDGVYVIIDWHCHNIRLEEAKIFFKEMAITYGKNPNIIYEIFNEPERNSWEQVKSYSTELISEIRKYDRNNIILIGSPHWDQDLDVVADNPITGFKNIMYTVHFYAATHKQWLRDKCNYAINKGLPLFVSESGGMEASGDGDFDYSEWNLWIDWMKQNNISWVSWSISDKNEKCSMVFPSANSEGGWTDNDLTESGKFVRNELRKSSLHNNK